LGKKCPAYIEDDGSLQKAFMSACSKREQFLKDLLNTYPLYRATWKGFDDQLYKTVEIIRHLAQINGGYGEKFKKLFELSNPKNICEFRKMFKFFSEQQLLC
jgi:hypothetical protein